jgi:uncharacterized protein (DUF362 family)
MAPQGDRTGRREALIRLARAGGLGAGVTGVALWLAGRSRFPEEPTAPYIQRNLAVKPDPGLPEMAVVHGDDARRLVQRAVEELGGMRRFVSRGDVVVIKPNVSWDRTPEQAANTNPDVVAETARLCLEAGAKRVIVADVCINEAQRCYERSGIGAAARSVGAQVVFPEERLLRPVDLRGETLRVWPVFTPFLEADKVINIPVAKHHSLTGVTLGLKSWYGILGGTRQRLHQRIHESLADLGAFLRPTLTIIDAYRVLLRGGPGGGSLEDVALKKTLIAGTDPVALDAYAAKAFWNLEVADLPYLQMAARRGLGKTDFARLRTKTVAL